MEKTQSRIREIVVINIKTNEKKLFRSQLRVAVHFGCHAATIRYYVLAHHPFGDYVFEYANENNRKDAEEIKHVSKKRGTIVGSYIMKKRAAEQLKVN